MINFAIQFNLQVNHSMSSLILSKYMYLKFLKNYKIDGNTKMYFLLPQVKFSSSFVQYSDQLTLS